MQLLLLFLVSAAYGGAAFTVPPGVCPPCFSTPTTTQSTDYGRIVNRPPAIVFSPRTPLDIALLLTAITNSSVYDTVTVGPNGKRHSTYGQAQVPGGVVLEMRNLPRAIAVDTAHRWVDADGGALWVEVLRETLKFGLSPRAWTDYLDLTVGGTLSVGGISGQVFRQGPQIVNVLEMDVITGTGEMVTCSMQANQDLFLGVLGGLGQFGVITRARIALRSAPQMAKRVIIPYDDFDTFTRDQELLIGLREPDYLEGQIIAQNATNITYEIELVLYYNQGDPIDKDLNRILSRLSSRRGEARVSNSSYFDFLNRVAKEEEELSKRGLWNGIPHPWLNILFPRDQIGKFEDSVLKTILTEPVNGPLLIYPFYLNKWDRRMSTVIPRDHSRKNIAFVVSILRSAATSCTPGSRCITELLNLNQKIIDASFCNGRKGGAKLYLAQWRGEEEWSAHFGQKWDGFKKLKAKYDPLHVLAPGPEIFQRIPSKRGL